jgi:pimeloyl-ACP methyl ester carboxylesterase
MSLTRERSGWQLVERAPAAPRGRVLLLPGLMGSDVVFRRLLDAPALQAGRIHVIAGNPPGFKGLPVPRGFDYGVESYAELVEALAAAEDIELILGHSYFANVLIEVAARRSFRGKLVLISPSLSRASETRDLQTLDRLSRQPLLRAPVWWLTYAMMSSVFKPYFSDPALLAEVTAAGKLVPRVAARRVLVAYFDHLDRHGDLAQRLLATEVPVRYLRGSEDDIGLTAAHRAVLARNPLLSLHEVAGARHFAMCDQPEAVAQHVVDAL